MNASQLERRRASGDGAAHGGQLICGYVLGGASIVSDSVKEFFERAAS